MQLGLLFGIVFAIVAALFAMQNSARVTVTVGFWSFEGVLGRLPLVQTIYGGTKRFLHSLRKPPATGQRVVLISFPSPEMKAVGFVTKVMKDADSGRELAAVYVPTSPNPTSSGYIEIVPLDEVVQTDWTMEEAMSFLMTGGANAPAFVRFTQPPHVPPSAGDTR